MATTKIWKVENNLQRIIDYAKNTHKTLNAAWGDKDYTALHDVLNYTENDYKTEQRFFVTGVNCLPETALEEMQLTKERYGKTSGILAFHAYQSFAEGEVTAESAHAVGVELAQKLWGERFEVIVATHLNTGHFHNHFVINSVSFLDGLRYYDNKKTYALLRRTSDEICHEHGLSIIEHPKGKGKHYAEWQAERDRKPTWRTAIREDIDVEILGSVAWKLFIRNMEARGYRFDFSHKHPMILPPGFKHYARLDNLGARYTPDAIMSRLARNRYPVRPPRPEPAAVRRVKVIGDFRLSKVTWKGLRALYFFYRHKLRQAAQQPIGYAPFVLREDIRLMDTIDHQTRFLFRYKVDTPEQLKACKEAIRERIDMLKAERTALINEKRRTDTTPERKAELEVEIRAYNGRLKPLYMDRKLADAVMERSLVLERNLEVIKEQKRQAEQTKTKSKKREERTR